MIQFSSTQATNEAIANVAPSRNVKSSLWPRCQKCGLRLMSTGLSLVNVMASTYNLVQFGLELSTLYYFISLFLLHEILDTGT